MREQLLLSVLSDLNSTSTDISASAVISTDGLPIATNSSVGRATDC
jgi:predicted regulator of Ras-like GTPase activity (Roadblock/LC7/MglB family)